MSFHQVQGSSSFRPLRVLLTSALTGLVVTAAACSSDSTDNSATGGSSGSKSGSGGTSSSTAGKGANDAGEASGIGGTVNPGTGGDATAGGAADDGGGGTAAGTTSNGGSSNTAGSSSAGSGGGGTLPGNDVWNCAEAGGSCICQNNGDPKTANKCTGTYKCCFEGPLGGSTRCQCQDPGNSKCSDLAGVYGPSGKVVDHCPP